jgi:hypothetical protein
VEKKADEFYNFRQEGKLVDNYAAEFDRLSKYCPRLVQDESNRVRRFINGLHLDLKKALIGMAPLTLSTTVEIATRIEGAELEQAKQKGKEGQRPPAQKRPGQPRGLRINTQGRERHLTPGAILSASVAKEATKLLIAASTNRQPGK